MLKALVPILILSSATTVLAQGAPNCTGVAPPPAELSAWSQPVLAKAANDAASLPGTSLAPGSAVEAALSPTPSVKFVAAPARDSGIDSFGGMFALEIKQAGTYRVALGSGAWLNLLQDGKPLMASAHGHGPDCSGIRKMVDFAVSPGHYVLQIEGNKAAKTTILAIKLP